MRIPKINDDYFDEAHELAMVGGTGVCHTLIEYNRKKRKGTVKRRPIGFITNLDEFVVDND